MGRVWRRRTSPDAKATKVSGWTKNRPGRHEKCARTEPVARKVNRQLQLVRLGPEPRYVFGACTAKVSVPYTLADALFRGSPEYEACQE